jgi:hypothetical protein
MGARNGEIGSLDVSLAFPHMDSMAHSIPALGQRLPARFSTFAHSRGFAATHEDRHP